MRPRIQAVPSVATVPNERWSTDIARIWTGRDGWVSLAHSLLSASVIQLSLA